MEPGYIINTPLPINQDFKSLKDEALAYIQEFGGYEWTNLNTSDPGVTIIDQLCYALTELGYCTDFSIKDILTNAKGKLALKNQFYLPENILTTSPVSFNDYRKYLIDRVPEIRNVMLYGQNNTFYQVYFCPKNDLGEIVNRQIEAETYYALNKCRNINELFLQPKTLEVVVQVLRGNLEIEAENKLPAILMAIHTAIENSIFPSVKQVGYDTLTEQGVPINEIFNGPLLQHGWITTKALGTPARQIAINEIAAIILSVAGVNEVSMLAFENPKNQLPTKVGQLLRIDLSGLSISCKGKNLNDNLAAVLSKTRLPEMDVVLGAAVNIQTELPKGKFRDINSYYSIQHTFPEIFGVGESAIDSNATNYQLARSRQLKGYLTLFDQVLANQFSQLANVDKLFSFKNPVSGNPSDVKEFYAVKDDYEKKHLTSPVPYLSFSPSYYFQSLYHAPHIRPLLKDNDMFKLTGIDETEKELDHASWINYKQNPYNPYIRGLMAFMQDENVDLTRRNNILDHLLARHGESPLIINAITEGTVYTGNQLKDQVIFKSVYLQNLGLLSYYRQKAYNFLAANRLSGLGVEIDKTFFINDTVDFVFIAGAVDHAEKLQAGDFINYAALELKLCLLFGLKMQYKNYLINHFGGRIEDMVNLEAQVAIWMIQQRKGLIFIETNLLWQHLNFEVTLKIGSDFWLVDAAVTFKQLLDINDFIIQNTAIVVSREMTQASVRINDFTYPLKQVAAINDLKLIGQQVICSVGINGGEELSMDQLDLLFSNRVVLVFPAFLNDPAFINRLETFLNQSLPIANTYQYAFEKNENLRSFINTFISWHNSLIFNPDKIEEWVTQAAVAMANALIKLNTASI